MLETTIPNSDFVDDMLPGAQSALSHVLNMKTGDKVLVVADQYKKTIGEAFSMSATKLGGMVDLYLLEENKRPYRSVPGELADVLAGHDIVINTFSSNAEETPFRVELTHLEIAKGSRVGHAPGITEDMMVGGPMNVNFHEIREKAHKLMNFLEGVSKVHITTEAGTDLRLNIKGRDFETDTEILPGKMGNLPAGEIWCAPIETEGEGIVIVDGTIGDIGKVPSPLTIEMEGGKVVSLASEDKGFVKEVRRLIDIDPMASVIGELGIGLNPKARLVGNMLEDEKAGRTAHIAFGANTDMPSGQNDSRTHRDFLFYEPNIIIEKNDEEITLLEKGRVVV